MGLDVLGLAEETERVYVALVAHPRCTASELGAACGLPSAKVGRLLSKLVADRLATKAAVRPPRYSATAPDVAVTTLIQEREEQLNEARSAVHRLMDMHREATRVAHPDLGVELLTDRDELSRVARRLILDAREQVRGFDRPPYVNRPGTNLDVQTQRQRAGIAHRVVYDREAAAWPGRMQGDILSSIRTGEKARIRPELPLKLVISDSEAAVVPFSLASQGQSAAYLIHRSPLLAALEALFEAEWERAVPLRDTDGTGTAGPEADSLSSETSKPDPETQSLLNLLASGLTDSAIARAQGWSERTTQRRIQRLMERLGASTRFQASLAAARRGWL
ncbi:helix-turn-helix domain-containing protein [Streptomyces sp. NPDC005708]|uniref:helix-turn-helix domain-containing protein n=1 Tax=Streptomyces sp. NPDC005708 TaxID=3154564 RepID=UPI0033CAF9B5